VTAAHAGVELRYDATLPHQIAAVDAVVDLFDGLLAPAQERLLGGDGFGPTQMAMGAGQLDLAELGFPNPVPRADLDVDATLLGALKAVQRRQGLEESTALAGHHFTVEMETGTGKTYVFLRTIFELHRRYGLRKFVIAVPSVAIREGVLASIRSMAAHFRGHYATPLDSAVYDSKRLGRVRNFATASGLQVLVMNIQSFQKDAAADDDTSANVINRAHDRMAGRRPIEFIQAMRPVVVIDEPQNFESAAARAAIDRLHPLCTLRYSATPRNPYNLVHRLGPVDAFRLGLVKQIEVDGVVQDDAVGRGDPHVRLLSVDATKNRARVEIDAGIGEAAKRSKVWVKRGDDLRVKSEGRPEYADGLLVDDILFAEGEEAIEFTGGLVAAIGGGRGDDHAAVQRMQISRTIRHHLDRELVLEPRGIKVLSLFFLDAVADYRVYTDDGDRLGPVGEMFEEELAHALTAPRYASLRLGDVSALHDAYFSRDSKNRPKNSRGNSEADTTTYELIMRDKQRLLSADEPLRFIFTHSALREGWDNPNVFQVCTLTRSGTAIGRRQQLGRGLRLPVDATGARVRDPQVARLTVIANESYRAFAEGLQVDYEKETGQRWGVVPRNAFATVAVTTADADGTTGEALLGAERSVRVWEHLRVAEVVDNQGRVTANFTPHEEGYVLPMPAGLEAYESAVITVLEPFARPPVRDARKRTTVRVNKRVIQDPDFQVFFRDIGGRTRFRVTVNTERVVREAVVAIRSMEPVTRPLVRSESASLTVDASGVRAGDVTGGGTAALGAPTRLPDILSDLQNATDLTRATLRRILTESDDVFRREFSINPHAFTVAVTRILRNVLQAELLEGVRYEPVGDSEWEMHELDPESGIEVAAYLDRLYAVQNADKSPLSHVEWDSSVEERFARRLDSDERVRLFMKLPPRFTVDTPVGPYNPDWAICWQDEQAGRQQVHLVRETKSTHEEAGRRGTENAKIRFASAHFDALDVDYAVVTDFDEVVTQMGA